MPAPPGPAGRRPCWRCRRRTAARRSFQELKELFMLPYVVGIVLSIGVALFARRVGFDRDRAFYPTVLIVVASYYVLFAVMSGSAETVLLESIIMALFAVAAVAGFKGSAWIVVAALAGHGVQDAVHGHIVANAGVPAWWPAWCLAYDVGAAGAFAWILMRADAPRLVVKSAAPSGARTARGQDRGMDLRDCVRQGSDSGRPDSSFQRAEPMFQQQERS